MATIAFDPKFVAYAIRYGANRDLSVSGEARKDGYPTDWDDIAHFIKTLAGYRCEHCHHPNDKRANRVLTVHHLDLIKAHCHYNNLVALCQKCHLWMHGIKWDPQQTWLFPDQIPGWVLARALGSHSESPPIPT